LDGLPARLLSFDEASGLLRVAPPPGSPGRRAVITVYNPDGQTSVFVQPSAPATFTYPPSAGPASLSLTPASAPAGRDTTIQIDGVNTNFVDGHTVVGFGASDVVTRQVWVLGPTRLLAVVSVSPRASSGVASTVSVTSGLQVTTLPAGFRVEAAPGPSNAPVIGFQGLVNSATLLPRVAPGSLVTLGGANLTLAAPAVANVPLPTTLAGSTVTINDQPVPLLAVSPTQINLQLPFNVLPGPAILRVTNGAGSSAPMVVQIDTVAPGLFRIVNAAGATVDFSNPSRAGDIIVLYGTGLGPVAPPATAGAPAPLANATAPVRVIVGGSELTPSFAGLAPGTAGTYQINVQLPAGLTAAAAVPVFITVDGQPSNVVTIAVR
jgi:uncharacterized protein (TIGR03437 family)